MKEHRTEHRAGLETLTLTVEGQEFELHPHRAVYWTDEKTLIVSDLHLGKIHHFRRSGIYLPPHAAMDNYERLSGLLLHYEPVKLLILGDLFHSTLNTDWKTFSDLRHTFEEVEFHLVLGNHDIIDPSILADNALFLHESLMLGPFQFSHYPEEENHSTHYNLAGHMHPGVRLVGNSRQSLKLPCFYFGSRNGILPAFGTFTGIALIRPEPGSQVVVISEEQLAQVQ